MPEIPQIDYDWFLTKEECSIFEQFEEATLDALKTGSRFGIFRWRSKFDDQFHVFYVLQLPSDVEPHWRATMNPESRA